MKPESELQRFDVPIPARDGKSVAEVVPVMVPVEWDEDAHDWVLTVEAMDLIEETKARHMGLLTPKEIRELRERLGHTQEQMSDLLKLGAKTWSRWETGRQRPSQSLNLLLRAIRAGVLTPYMLCQLGYETFDWSAAVSATSMAPEPVTMVFPQVEPNLAGTYEEMPLAS